MNKIVNVDKRSQASAVETLVLHDQNTAVLTLMLNRYANGVDLSGLGFSVLVKNARGDQDVIPVEAEILDEKIKLDWTVPQIVCAAEGITEISVRAVNVDSEQVWASSTRYINVVSTTEAEPNYDEHTLSEFDRVIQQATVELGEMRTTMAGFEERIEEAVKAANDAADDLRDRAERGEFNGKDGYTPVKGIDYNDGADGYTPVKGVDYRDGVDGKTPVKGVDYRDGVDGKTPEKGVDYYTTAERDEMVDAVKSGVQPSITDLNKAINANNEALSQLEDVVEDKADKTELANKVGYSEVVNGQLLMYSDSTKTKLLATMDLPTSTPTDVQINGTSITENGVANIPYPTGYGGSAGVINTWADYGLNVTKEGRLYVYNASQALIDSRGSSYRPITPDILNPAVKAALTDSNKIVLSDTEKAAACETLGAVYDGKYTIVSALGVSTPITSYTFEFDTPLRSIIVFINAPATSFNQAFMLGYVNGNMLVVEQNNVISTTARKTWLFISTEHGIVESKSLSSQYNNSNGITPMNKFVVNDLIFADEIDSLRLVCNGSAQFPVGTEIKVWGY